MKKEMSEVTCNVCGGNLGSGYPYDSWAVVYVADGEQYSYSDLVYREESDKLKPTMEFNSSCIHCILRAKLSHGINLNK